MNKDKKHDEKFFCPVGEFFMNVEKSFGEKSLFVKHISRSKIEFLKAVRSLVDERIESLEKRSSDKAKKMTKIKVE